MGKANPAMDQEIARLRTIIHLRMMAVRQARSGC
jgi:hypothetical protein